MGRAGQVGDEIGSTLIAGRLVRDLMRLCFLMEGQYAPYPKWYGTAFARLEAARALSSPLWRILRAETWLDRDRALGEAYSMVVRLHNELDLTEPLSVEAVRFFGRPFSVIFGERIAKALSARIQDSHIRRIPLLIGGLDQWSDSTDVLEAAVLRSRFKVPYGEPDCSAG